MINLKVTREGTGFPSDLPLYVVIVVRRETYRGLLGAAEFLRGVRGESEDMSGVVDELLVAFSMSRQEAAKSR